MVEKLQVYQRALAFADTIITLTQGFPKGFYFLSDQLNRASTSIAANIAEGNGRFTKADRRHFFVIARSSAHECLPFLDLANRRGFILDDQFEELKLSLSSIAKLSDLDFKRNFETYSIDANPEFVAKTIRKKLYPSFNSDKRGFLRDLITKFAEQNIFVFEFIETWNKRNKANIDGFFLKPNMIVLKRHQTFRREIFTLAHELAHYLLGEEEIEQINLQTFGNKNLSKIERWCNDFAYYFLIGNYSKSVDSLEKASLTNDYHFEIIKKISDNTHLSQIALFTRLLYQGQISKKDYSNVKSEFDERYRKMQEDKERQKQLLLQQGKKLGGAVAKPISSPLFISTVQTAYYEGLLNEYEVCKKLNIKPNKLDKYIQ